jgi:hypothetical protein
MPWRSYTLEKDGLLFLAFVEYTDHMCKNPKSFPYVEAAPFYSICFLGAARKKPCASFDI